MYFIFSQDLELKNINIFTKRKVTSIYTQLTYSLQLYSKCPCIEYEHMTNGRKFFMQVISLTVKLVIHVGKYTEKSRKSTEYHVVMSL